MRHVWLPGMLAASNVVSLHCPLTPDPHPLIDADVLARTKPGAMLLDTGRGALVDTAAPIASLKSRRPGSAGLDVCEEESFRDLSSEVFDDDVFARLLTSPDVHATGLQAFFTEQVLIAIATTTLANIAAFDDLGRPLHPTSVERVVWRRTAGWRLPPWRRSR